MSFSFNGNTPRKIIFNNQDVKKLIYNNDVVWEKKRLPVEYQEVEYIESTGTQYINTNYTPVQGDNIKIEKVKQADNNNGVLFSAGNGTYQLILYCMYAQRNLTYWKYFAAGDAASFYSPLSDFTEINIIDGKIYYDNVIKATSKYSGQVDTALQLFRRASEISYISATMGRFTITNGNTIKLDLIPCYKKSNNEIGFYDIINDVFYANQGTGTFIKGPDIN